MCERTDQGGTALSDGRAKPLELAPEVLAEAPNDPISTIAAAVLALAAWLSLLWILAWLCVLAARFLGLDFDRPAYGLFEHWRSSLHAVTADR
jgi:hypothetical protein